MSVEILANDNPTIMDKMLSLQHDASEKKDYSLEYIMMVISNHKRSGTLSQVADLLGKAHGTPDWIVFISRCSTSGDGN